MKNFLEKVKKKGPAGRRGKKIEKVTGLGIRTREETAKWNEMTALRFQTGEETSDIPGLPSEADIRKRLHSL